MPPIRLVLTLAITYGWSIRQLDVNNAFFHGTIIEDVYMAQSLGFVDPLCPDHVCHFKKSI